MWIKVLLTGLVGLGACGLGYGETLQSYLDGDVIKPSGDGGDIQVVSLTMKKGMDQSFEFPELNIHSEDNYSNLKEVSLLLESAGNNNVYGDYLYWWTVLKYQGDASDLALDHQSAFAEEVRLFQLSSDMLHHLMLTSSNTKLRAYYLAMLNYGSLEDSHEPQPEEVPYEDNLYEFDQNQQLLGLAD